MRRQRPKRVQPRSGRFWVGKSETELPHFDTISDPLGGRLNLIMSHPCMLIDIDVTFEFDQAKFFQEHADQVFAVTHDSFWHQIEKFKQKPDRNNALQSKEVLAIQKTLLLLRLIFLYLPDRMKNGWHRRPIGELTCATRTPTYSTNIGNRVFAPSPPLFLSFLAFLRKANLPPSLLNVIHISKYACTGSVPQEPPKDSHLWIPFAASLDQ
jgi:hypothetical protein